MLSYSAYALAPPDAAWSLIARPGRWPEWAPHLRGAWGLGDGEVRAGARGAARLLGVVPVPARITAKEPGVAWEWTVGPVVMDHRVEPAFGGESHITVTISAPEPLERALGLTYGPVVQALVRRLARVAADSRP